MSLCDRDDCARYRRAMRLEQEMRRQSVARIEELKQALTTALDLAQGLVDPSSQQAVEIVQMGRRICVESQVNKEPTNAR